MMTSKKANERLGRVVTALSEYRHNHRKAEIAVKEQNPVSIRIRVIDPDFADFDRIQRESAVWQFLDTLPEDIRADITMLVLLTPREAKDSLLNFEFDNPTKSRL